MDNYVFFAKKSIVLTRFILYWRILAKEIAPKRNFVKK